MLNIFFINNFILLVIDILGIWLAFWVYVSDRKRKVNQGFLLMVLSVLSWITCYQLATPLIRVGSALSWFRLATASVFLFFVSAYYLFVRWFLKRESIYLWLGRMVLGLGVVFAILSFSTNWVISDLQTGKWWVVPNFSVPGRIIFYTFVIFLTFFINGELLRGYFKASKERKLKTQYFLIGILIFAFLNFVFNVILPFGFGNYHYYYLGNYSAVFLLGLTAFAITKYHLFGIKVILTELLVGVMGVALAVLPFLMPSLELKVLTVGILGLFAVFGYVLIRATHREIERREKLQKAYAELEKIDKAKLEFIAMASHQLRTPLAIIKGYAASLIEETYGKIPKPAKERLRHLLSSNQRLIDIVENLLNVSRIEMGEMPTDFKKTQIEDLIDQIYQEMKIKAEKKNLNFIWNKPETPLPKADIDSAKISQVVINLIDNAIRYTHSGKVEIRVNKIDQKIQVIVEDTGEGLTKEDQETLFTAFTRGEAGTDYWIQGAGLGLFLAEKYVKLHNGKLWAESEGKGKGSTFYVELPIERPEDSE